MSYDLFIGCIVFFSIIFTLLGAFTYSNSGLAGLVAGLMGIIIGGLISYFILRTKLMEDEKNSI